MECAFAASASSSHEIDVVVFEGGTFTDALEGLLEAKLVDSPPAARSVTWPTKACVETLTR